MARARTSSAGSNFGATARGGSASGGESSGGARTDCGGTPVQAAGSDLSSLAASSSAKIAAAGPAIRGEGVSSVLSPAAAASCRLLGELCCKYGDRAPEGRDTRKLLGDVGGECGDSALEAVLTLGGGPKRACEVGDVGIDEGADETPDAGRADTVAAPPKVQRMAARGDVGNGDLGDAGTDEVPDAGREDTVAAAPKERRAETVTCNGAEAKAGAAAAEAMR